MEVLSAIVSGVVTKLAEYAVTPVGRQVGYVIQYNSNLQNLRTKVQNLKERRQRTIDVNRLTQEIDELTVEVDTFLENEGHAKTKCFQGFCPNPILYYQLSKKAKKLVQKIEPYEKTEFPPQEICSVPSQDYLAFGSRISVVMEIMKELRNPNTNKIGVWGVGGVGKTTLAKEVYRQANEEKLFDGVVIIVDVKNYSGPERIQKEKYIERIQNEIAEKLDIDISECLTEKGKARHLWDKLIEKKILVILDDVWERIELEVVGIPPTCNMLFTSRSREVLFSEMDIQKEFCLHTLGGEESWSLFEKMAGGVVKEALIREKAIQLSKKCGGLPILIVTVARALRNSNSLHDWRDALRRLTRLDMKNSEEKPLLTLEWSYNQLDSEELKSMFLVCGILAMLMWDNVIHLDYCFKYSMGMGLLKNVDTIEEAQDAFHSLIKKLKNYCLLLEHLDGNRYVRMHELLCNVAIRIARRDKHALVSADEEEFKTWPGKEFFRKCTIICIRQSKMPKLPQVPWECRELKLLIFDFSHDSVALPCNFFEDMKELKVLDLSALPIPSLPSSLQFLTNLQTLCLDRCALGDISLVGQLRNLEILSFLESKIKQLPEEIGQLTHLRLLDLTGCLELVLIPPNVLSSLKSLEDLRMGGNSFRQWEAEGIDGSKRTTNASLSELKQLSKLTALDIHIPDARVLQSGLFLHLERYHVFIGEEWKWLSFDSSFNTLKLKLATSNQLDRGLEMLVKRSQHLYLDVMEGVNDIFHVLNSDGYQQLKHLLVQNNGEIRYVINHDVFQKLQSLTLMNLPKLVSFSSKSRTAVATTTTDEQLKSDGECKEIILENEIESPVQLFKNGEIVMPNLTILIVHKCDGLRFLLSSSMAKSLVQLKHLEVLNCQIMEEIVSTKKSGEEMNTYIFCKLKHLQLQHLPQLTRFCVGNYIKFPSLEILHVEDCTKLETFIFDYAMIKSEETNSKDNLETPGPYFLFDDKVGFPRLERLVIYALPKLITIWHNQLSQDSFCRLRKVDVQRCHNLTNIFAASIMKRLNALDTLQIRNCMSIQVVFELGGVNVERHDDPSTTQVRMSYCQNLDLIEIDSCECLKNILPVSVAKGLEQLRKLSVKNCDGVEAIVAKDGQKTTPNFVFPKATSVTFCGLLQIKCFYNGRYTSKWPLLNELWVKACPNVDIFASNFSRFQENLVSIQPFFLIEKDSFPNLEHLTLGGTKLEICDGPLPAEMFSKLKYLNIASPRFKSSYAFLEKLHNLEKFIVHDSLLEEIFVDQGNGSWQIHAVGTHLPHLTSLMLKELSMLMHLGKENSQPIIPNLEILEVSVCGKLKNLSSPAISFQNLTTLKVIGCQGLEYLITSSIAQSLMQLTHLEVKDCQRLVQIVGSRSEDEAGNEIAFNRLEHLELSGLPSLQCFFSGTMLSHQFTICEEIEESGDTKENLGSAVQYFLFDKEVGLPRLQTLIVHDLHKLMTIWHEQVAPDSFGRLKTVDVQRCSSLINIFGASILGRLNALDTLKLRQCQSLRLVFKHGGINAEEEDDTSITPSKLLEYCQNLVSVEIDSCESLRNIFPASVARGLQQLRKLSVENCVRVEEIVAMEGLGMTTPEFVFPNATSVIFRNLPRLSSFYPGMHASVWPLLKELSVMFCDYVEIFAVGLVGTAIRQPLFLIEKGSFSNLELLHFDSKVGTMKNWWSLLPAEFFSKLKSLGSQSGVFQSGFLQNLPHLEDLGLFGFEKEVFVHEGISIGEIQAVGTLLPHLKSLWVGMPELMNLGKENAQPVIPNLEVLGVLRCGKLKNLRSSAISFQNLKSLVVKECHGLEYLTTYSIAQSLMQLIHMEVKDCRRLIEIVANSDQADDAVNEIAFMRLQQLKLSDLPSLQGFCSGNCIVKLPSLRTLTVTECRIDMKISPDKVLLSNSKPERLKLIEEEAKDHDKPEGSVTSRTQAT